MGEARIVTGIFMVVLFSIALLGFAYNFTKDNDSAVNINDDPQLTFLKNSLENNASALSSEAQDTYTSIVETTISREAGTAQSAAPFAITPLGSISILKNILKVGYIKIFGTGSGFGLFLTALISAITFLFGLWIYKALRGMPD